MNWTTADRRIFLDGGWSLRLLLAVVAAGFVLLGGFWPAGEVAPRLSAATDYGLLVPMRVADGNWWVCQGYNNTSISHYGVDRYGLDLIPDRNAVGSTGCRYSRAAEHKRVYTPVDGWIAWKADSIGVVCINLRSGSTGLGMSIKVGHMKTRAATPTYPAEWRSVPVNGRVHQGYVLGYVATANEVSNGGVGHIHIGIYKGTGCAGKGSSATPIPFSSAYGTTLTGLSCSTRLLKVFDLPSNGTFNQYAGTRPLCLAGAMGGPG